ncbi:hypothetical protein [Hyalangium minutum]|uniref:Uncharacterized protein n=1 Tax=Hyalangium minutum TaxID=394096 RepID=A0A085WPK7_9BACT|nr:hypothetical protein [Hyalangium minutum]KFE69620.1 hypothetical protein DB31_6595 [Hyalangium minutum]
MNLLALLTLLVVVGLPAVGNAQAADAPATSSQPATAPPLITAPPEAAPAEQTSPAEQAPSDRPLRGHLLPPEWQSRRPNYFVPRVLAGTVLGTLAGTGGLIGGFLIGLALEKDCNPFDDVCSSDEIFVQTAPALLATGLLSSLTVYGIGSALHGEGALSTTLWGGFAGTGLGALLMVATQSYGGIVLIPPLAAIGALVAYELSDSEWEREQVKARLGGTSVQLVPVVGVTQGGGVLGGLAGRF